MRKSKLLDEIQREIYRHGFGTFVADPPLTSQGGKGVVVAGCPAGRKRLQSMNEFLDNLAKDVMPKLLGQCPVMRARQVDRAESTCVLLRESTIVRIAPHTVFLILEKGLG